MREVSDFGKTMSLMNDLNVSLLALGHVKADSETWRFDDLFIPFNKLYFMLGGEITVVHKNLSGQVQKTYHLTAGNVYFIPSNNLYDFLTPTQFEKYFMHMNINMVDGQDLLSCINEVIEIPFDMSVFDQMQEKMENSDIDVLFLMKEITDDVVKQVIHCNKGRVLERLKRVGQYSPLVLDAIQYIDENLSARLKIGLIARQFSISSQVLSSQFREEVGIGLKKYINTKLSKQAQKLLLETPLSVKEISYELGFTDQYNFSKFFKTLTNRSPIIYREELENYINYMYK